MPKREPAVPLAEMLSETFTRADGSSIPYHEALPEDNADLVVAILFTEGEGAKSRGCQYWESTQLIRFYDLVNSEGKKFEIVTNTRGRDEEFDQSRIHELLNLKVHGEGDVAEGEQTRPVPWLLMPVEAGKYSGNHKINYDKFHPVPFPELHIFARGGQHIESNTGGDYGLELFHNEDMDNCLRKEDPKKACMDLHAQWLEKIKEAAGREW